MIFPDFCFVLAAGFFLNLFLVSREPFGFYAWPSFQGAQNSLINIRRGRAQLASNLSALLGPNSFAARREMTSSDTGLETGFTGCGKR